MIWYKETFEAKRKRLGEWRKWYAWYPVTAVDDERDDRYATVWFDYVERKKVFHYGFGWTNRYRIHNNQ